MIVDSGATSAFNARPASGGRRYATALTTRLGAVVMPSVSTGAYIFLYIPIIALIVYSFDRSAISSSWTGFTFRWYTTLFADSQLLAALRVSLVVAGVSAAISTVLGILSAIALSRVQFHGKRVFSGLLLLPLLMPEIVLSIALLTLIGKLGLGLGYWSLIAGHVVLTLPYTTLLLVGAMSRMEPSLEEAAADLGCGRIQGFRRVTLPLLLPAILGALLLSFTTSFQDVVMSNFVDGPTTTPLPVYVYSLLKTGLTPELNALGTMLVTATVCGVLLVGARRIGSFVSRSSRTETAD